MQSQQDTNDNHAERIFLRQRDLLNHYLPFSATTLWRKVKKGEFPAPVKFGPSITAWKSDEVHSWLDTQTNAGKR